MTTPKHSPKLLTMPCGCWASPGGIKGKHWRFCKMHAAAKPMLDALNDLLKYDRVQHRSRFGFSKLAPLDGQTLRVYFARARAAVAKAEGRTE